jgi:hypothetical protein
MTMMTRELPEVKFYFENNNKVETKFLKKAQHGKIEKVAGSV